MSDDHPRASVEQVRIGSPGSAALATRHRVGADVARRRVKTSLRAQTREDIGNDSILHRRNVGDNRVGETQQRLDDDAVGDIRGCRDDDETWSLVAEPIRAAPGAAHPGLGENVTKSLTRTDIAGQAQ